MKVYDYSFRELDRKWAGIVSEKACKKIAKKIKKKYLQSPIFGYFYIDKENGLSFRVVGNIERDGRNKLYLDDEFILNNEIDLDYEFISKYDIEILSDKVVNNLDGANILENKLDINYKNVNDFLETRKMEELDPFRNEQFPDDIQVLLNNKNDDPDELLWARIEGIMDVKPDVLICRLLTASYYNKDYELDAMIGVKFFKEEEQLRIVGTLKRREKNKEG